jgi:hypothetical protein
LIRGLQRAIDVGQIGRSANIPNYERYRRDQRGVRKTPCLQGSCVTDLRRNGSATAIRHGNVTWTGTQHDGIRHPGCFIFDVFAGQPLVPVLRHGAALKYGLVTTL